MAGMKRTLCYLSLIYCLLMSACTAGGDSAPVGTDLPTLASLPTLAPTNTPVPLAAVTEADLNDAPTPSETPTEAADALPTETPAQQIILPTNATGPSLTPSATITYTPSPTLTPTASATNPPSAITGLIALALQATPLPAEFVTPIYQPGELGLVGAMPTQPLAAPSTCAFPPAGGFNAVYMADATLNQLLGCPLTTIPSTVNGAVQPFQTGLMIWADGPIYVFYQSGQYQRYTDTFVEGVDPSSGGEQAPDGLIEPVRGFGKVWRMNPDVRAGLGWATSGESGGQITIQLFERGQMISIPQRGEVIVIGQDAGGSTGSWRSFTGQF